jgi:hypothetical protein
MTKKNHLAEPIKQPGEWEVDIPYSPPEPTSPAASNALPPEGMETFEREDIIIPRMRIVQPTSEEGTPGTFRLNITGDEYQTIEVVFIKAIKSRVMFDSDLNKGPLCGSLDRINPSSYFSLRDRTPMADKCAGCPYAEWGKDREAPQCNESYTLLGLDINTRIPFFLTTRSTGIKPTKMFLSAIFLKAKMKKAALSDFKVTLSLKEVKNDRGRFYVPVFERPTYLDDHPFKEDAEIYKYEEPVWEETPKQASANDGSSTKEGIPF